jgi:glycosyltransferase involved in cell wall biosynthesis
VIIPVKDGGAAFRRCLTSLYAATAAPLEVIVVADGDTSGSFRAAQAFGAHILELPETGGPARARNLGAGAARGEVLMFLDADVAVHEDALGRVRDCFAGDAGLAALFGSYDDAPAAPNFLSQYRNLLHHFVHQTSRREASTFWSGCGAIRREVFLSMGGFDERYRRPSIEDIELGYRLFRAGHRVQLEKSVLGTHLKEWRAASILRTDFAQRAVPWTELILRDGRFVSDLNLRNGSRVSVGLAYLSLLALGVSPWQPGGLVAALGLLLALLFVNAQLLTFFLRKRGALFTLRVIPWLVLYQLYSGLGFIVGALRHLGRARAPAGG